MQNVHLAPEEDEDDLYSGYNDYNPTFDTEVKMFALACFSYRESVFEYEIKTHECGNVQGCFEVKRSAFCNTYKASPGSL